MEFPPLTLSVLVDKLDGAKLEGNSNAIITGVSGLQKAGPGDLSFLANPRYAPALAETRATAVIIAENGPTPPKGVGTIRVKSPYLSFARALQFLLPPKNHLPGAHSGAWVHPGATLATGATVYPGAYVGEGSTIGQGSVVYPGAVVMEKVKIGEHCLLYPGVVVREECTLGDRVVLHGNVTIGADGYGYAQDNGVHVKIPQVGTVIIEDDVEIGAGTCVDRAAMGATRIGRGTKIDDLVMIGHGSRVGEHALIVAQSGLAGSAVLEDRVVVGARGGVLGHLTIGEGSVIYSRSHVTKSLTPGSHVSGNPARPHTEQLRQEALLKRLDTLSKRVSALEKQLEDK